MTSSSLLGVYGVSYCYGSRKVLDEVSFEVEEGEILTVLGPNGSGKSTLLKSIAGLLPLNGHGCSGQIRHRGNDFLALDQQWRARTIAYVGAEVRTEFPLTAHEAVMLGRICQSGTGFRKLSDRDEQTVRQAMEDCLCWHLRERELSSLSGGEKQLVLLARALSQGAHILLLDEALSKMDLNHLALIGRMLREKAAKGLCILLVSHDINVAVELSESCLLLKSGKRIGHGKISKILTPEKFNELYPGADFQIECISGNKPKIQLGFFQKK